MNKYALTTIAAVAMLATVGCHKHKTTPATPTDCYNFEKTVAADIEIAKATVKEGEKLSFYEVETVLNGCATNDSVKVVALMSVFQMGDRCLMIKHNEGAYTNAPETVIADPGHWLGDWELPLETPKVTFADAVQRLKEWNGIIPTGDKMTYRRPQGTHNGTNMWDNGQYIFGTTGTGFVAVDSVTRAVEEVGAGSPFTAGSLQEQK